MARKGQGGRWFVYFLLQQVQRVGTYEEPEPEPPIFSGDVQIRVIIGDRNGRVLTEVEPDVGPVSWRLNKVGKCSLIFAKSDDKANSDNLHFGNRVLIQFQNGLPNWGGIITQPRTWGPSTVTVALESAETLFERRITDRGRYFTQATVGYIFRQLIAEANAVRALGIEVGNVWMGGNTHSPEYHLKDLLNIFQKSVCERLSNADFAVIPSLEDGYIKFTAELYERRGYDKDNVVLLEGQNLSDVKLKEQGPVINAYTIAGAGSTWGSERPMSNGTDDNSIQAHGYWEAGKVFASISNPDTLDETATTLLSETANPRNLLSLQATNTSPAEFAQYDVGDSIRAILYGYGFSDYNHMVRVIAREFNPGSGVCKLVLQEDD